MGLLKTTNAPHHHHEHDSDAGEEDQMDHRSADRQQPHQEENNRQQQQKKDYSLVQMLQTPSALLMLWTTTILVGAGTVETNNMGQMVEALGFDKAVTPASLALFSVAQAFSRVMTGALSEAALHWNLSSSPRRQRLLCMIDYGLGIE